MTRLHVKDQQRLLEKLLQPYRDLDDVYAWAGFFEAGEEGAKQQVAWLLLNGPTGRRLELAFRRVEAQRKQAEEPCRRDENQRTRGENASD